MENVCWWECMVHPLGYVWAASCSLVEAGLFWVSFGWKSSQLTLIFPRVHMRTGTLVSVSLVPYFRAAVMLRDAAARASRKKLGLVCPEDNGCFGGRNVCLCLTVSCWGKWDLLWMLQWWVGSLILHFENKNVSLFSWASYFMTVLCLPGLCS